MRALEKKKYVLEVLFTLLFLMGFVGNALAEKMIRIANVDNFIMHKYLLKNSVYSEELEKILDNVDEKMSVLGTSWKNKKYINKDSLVEKVIKQANPQDFGLKYQERNGRIKEVIYPSNKSGWTKVDLEDSNKAEGIILEIEGGDREPIHQRVGNIAIKNSKGMIEDIPVVERGVLDKKKGSVLVLSDDYLFSRKREEIQKIVDEELEWKEGIKILIARKMFPEVPGQDERFTIHSISYENENDNDTVFIFIAAAQRKSLDKEFPSLLFGWKTKEVSCTSGGGN